MTLKYIKNLLKTIQKPKSKFLRISSFDLNKNEENEMTLYLINENNLSLYPTLNGNNNNPNREARRKSEKGEKKWH